MFLRVILAFVLALLVSPTFANDSNEVRKSLGGHPVCEASAAIVVDCPEKKDDGKKKRCLLVGDNEIKDRLFLYRISGDDQIRLKKERELKLGSLTKKGKYEISDIEALVSMPNKEILIFGSQSRNKECEAKKKRRRFAQGTLKKKKIGKGSGKPVKSDEHTCKSLFGKNPNDVMQIVCAEIERTEAQARAAESKPSKPERKDACSVSDPAFNLEGAVRVSQPGEEPRVWIGLRAPLVGGKAVLLRQVKGLDAFRFDGVAFLDLKGPGEKGNYGIRELTLHGDKVWGIGGPPSDPPEDKDPPRHTLWSFKAAELEPGAEPVVFPSKRTLPPSAEGLAVVDKRAFVLIDGDQPKKVKKQCEIPSEYIVIDDFDS